MDAEVRRQFAALGVTIASETHEAEETVEVWAPNWPAVCAFLACETQWRASATMAGLVWIGLDYTAVDVALRRRGLDCDFADLQAMEDAALTILNRGDA